LAFGLAAAVAATGTGWVAPPPATGFVVVGRGTDKSHKDANVVGRGKSQKEADENAMTELNKAGATKNQRIVYRYFSNGAETNPSGH